MLVAVLWIASLGLAWMVGSQYGEESSAHAERLARGDLVEPPARRELVGQETAGATPGSDGAERAARKDPARPDAEVTAEDEAYVFTLEGVESLEELSARFMRYADIKLRQGPEGQMELLRKMDELTQDESIRMLMRDEREGMRLLYPWIRFLVDREGQVLAMTETIYRKAAKEPAAFEGLDDNTLEIFTEGVAMLLPSAVDEETLDRYREYAETILAMPQDSLPKALKKNSSELRRNLEYWAAPMSSEQLRAQLADPSVPLDQRLRILSRASKEELEGVDLVGLLEQPLAEGNRSVLSVLGRLRIPAADAAALDRAFFLGVETGNVRAWEIRSYLRASGRNDWAQARPIIEEGLRRGGQAMQAFAQSLMYLSNQPPKTYIESLLASYDLDEGTVSMLKRRYGIQ
jgi:hypothetical protein